VVLDAQLDIERMYSRNAADTGTTGASLEKIFTTPAKNTN
jgi:hypothetical protein